MTSAILEGYPKCPHCNKEVPRDAVWCVPCNKAIPKAKPGLGGYQPYQECPRKPLADIPQRAPGERHSELPKHDLDPLRKLWGPPEPNYALKEQVNSGQSRIIGPGAEGGIAVERDIVFTETQGHTGPVYSIPVEFRWVKPETP